MLRKFLSVYRRAAASFQEDKFVFVLFLVVLCAGSPDARRADGDAGIVGTPGMEDCEVARMKCAYRVGCGMALQNYVIGCGDVMTGKATRCSEHCKKALIAITSTEEGQALMKCDCRNNEFCDDTKKRIEICRADVLRATATGAVVSCSVAQWICAADPLCSTALEYYRQLCKGMLHGKKCNRRCNNSIAILNRQEKAAKLKNCYCDGTEDYDCRRIKSNMDRLCFRKTKSRFGAEDIDNNIQADYPEQSISNLNGDKNSNSQPFQSRSAFICVLLTFFLNIWLKYIFIAT